MQQQDPGRDRIGQVVIACSVTGKWLYTGVALTPIDFVLTTLGERVVAHCPHCSRHHRWTKHDAALEGPWPALPAAQLNAEPPDISLT